MRFAKDSLRFGVLWAMKEISSRQRLSVRSAHPVEMFRGLLVYIPVATMGPHGKEALRGPHLSLFHAFSAMLYFSRSSALSRRPSWCVGSRKSAAHAQSYHHGSRAEERYEAGMFGLFYLLRGHVVSWRPSGVLPVDARSVGDFLHCLRLRSDGERVVHFEGRDMPRPSQP